MNTVWQQWVTILGLTLNLIGFILVATEWHRSFKHAVYIRNRQLHDAYERKRARREGREPPYSMEDEDEAMAKVFSKLHNAEVHVRYSLFFFGIIFVVAGYFLQVIGSWPIISPA